MTSITQFRIAPEGYTVRCNSDNARGQNTATLQFGIDLTQGSGGDEWVEHVLEDIKTLLIGKAKMLEL